MNIAALILLQAALTGNDFKDQPSKLELTFIGNEAFQITDGRTTLLSDFPYKSGAFGYMSYDMDKVKPVGKVLCAITHEHDDHFSPELWDGKGWHLIASPLIRTTGDQTLRLKFSEQMVFEGMAIHAIKTPHTDAHYSYLVEWSGRRLYFPGDTESLEFLPKEKVDVLFLTPWLIAKALATGTTLNATRVVAYHHRKGETGECNGCTIPQQGDKIVIE